MNKENTSNIDLYSYIGEIEQLKLIKSEPEGDIVVLLTFWGKDIEIMRSNDISKIYQTITNVGIGEILKKELDI